MAEGSQHLRNNSAIFNSTRGERHPWDYDPLMSFRQQDSPDTRNRLPIFTTAMSFASSRRSSLSGSEVDLSERESERGSERGLSRSRRSSAGGVEVVTTALKPRLSKNSFESKKGSGTKSGIPKPVKKTTGLPSSKRALPQQGAAGKSRLAGGGEKQGAKKKKGPKEAPEESKPLSPWTAKEDIISPIVFTSSPSKSKGLFIEIPGSTEISRRSSFVAASDDGSGSLDGRRQHSARLSDQNRSSKPHGSELIHTAHQSPHTDGASRSASRLGSSQRQSPLSNYENESAHSDHRSDSQQYLRDVHSSAASEISHRSSLSFTNLVTEDGRASSVGVNSRPASTAHSTRAPSRSGSQLAGAGLHQAVAVDPRLSGASSRASLGDFSGAGSVHVSHRGSPVSPEKADRLGSDRLDTSSRSPRLDELRGTDGVRRSSRGSIHSVREAEADKLMSSRASSRQSKEDDAGRAQSSRNLDGEESGRTSRSSRLAEREESTRGGSSSRAHLLNEEEGGQISRTSCFAERQEGTGGGSSSRLGSYLAEKDRGDTGRTSRSSRLEEREEAAGGRSSSRAGDAEDSERFSRSSRLDERKEPIDGRAPSRGGSYAPTENASPRSLEGSTRARSSISAAIAAADLAVAAAMRGRASPTSDPPPKNARSLSTPEKEHRSRPTTRSASPGSPKEHRSRSTSRTAQERKAQLLSAGKSSVSSQRNSVSPRRVSGAPSPLGSPRSHARSPLSGGSAGERSLLRVALTSPTSARARASFASSERGRSPTREGTRRRSLSYTAKAESESGSPRRSVSSTRGGLKDGSRSPSREGKKAGSGRSSRAPEGGEEVHSGRDSAKSSKQPSRLQHRLDPKEEGRRSRGDERTESIIPRKSRHSSSVSNREASPEPRSASRSRSPSVAHSHQTSRASSPTKHEPGSPVPATGSPKATSPTGSTSPIRRMSISIPALVSKSIATSPTGSRSSSLARHLHSPTPKSPLGSVRRSFVAPTSPSGSLTSPRRPWGSAAPKSLPSSPRGTTPLSRFKEEQSPKLRRNSVSVSPTRDRARGGGFDDVRVNRKSKSEEEAQGEGSVSDEKLVRNGSSVAGAKERASSRDGTPEGERRRGRVSGGDGSNRERVGIYELSLTKKLVGCLQIARPLSVQVAGSCSKVCSFEHLDSVRIHIQAFPHICTHCRNIGILEEIAHMLFPDLSDGPGLFFAITPHFPPLLCFQNTPSFLPSHSDVSSSNGTMFAKGRKPCYKQ
jgi:hypothetical protein